MVALTNPINSQNIVNRFADYVTATADTGITWGTNALPTYTTGTTSVTVVAASYFGGTTTGRAIGITGSSVGAVGSTITAAGIYSALLAETAAYTSIRNLRAQLNVTGTGDTAGGAGNTSDGGPLGNPFGIVYDTTAVAYMNPTYLQTLGSVSGQPAQNTPISATGLETYFTNLRSAYNTARSTTVTITTSVCHASCHSSCHGSRGRR